MYFIRIEKSSQCTKNTRQAGQRCKAIFFLHFFSAFVPKTQFIKSTQPIYTNQPDPKKQTQKKKKKKKTMWIWVSWWCLAYCFLNARSTHTYFIMGIWCVILSCTFRSVMLHSTTQLRVITSWCGFMLRFISQHYANAVVLFSSSAPVRKLFILRCGFLW